MKQFTFIVNPVAGKGAGKKVFESLLAELNARQVSFDVVETRSPGHATVIAAGAGSTTVVGVGGDGTLNEIANGLAGSSKSLGIIPAGSGNDFIKSAGIPRKPSLALMTLLEGTPREVDIGAVRCTESREGGGNFAPRLFVNGVGAGFDAAVAAKTREIRYLGGTALYVAAVLQTLGKYNAPNFTIAAEHYSREAPGLLIAVGNGRCAGGGFYLTPDARVDDGLLDVCSVDNKNVFQILRLMPLVMRGKHHNVPGVKFFRDKQLTITADEPFYVHADGEIVGANVRRVEIGLFSSKLNVITRHENGRDRNRRERPA